MLGFARATSIKGVDKELLHELCGNVVLLGVASWLKWPVA
jgi:hypothetical protein